MAADEHADADQPCCEQRSEVTSAREVDAEESLAGKGKHITLSDQIRRTEDRQQDLRELAGL